jgi:hypothetical protein
MSYPFYINLGSHLLKTVSDLLHELGSGRVVLRLQALKQ